MARWFTWRRLFVYSAYFTGVFSLLIGLFISKHVWTLHTTIRAIEKSWDVRGHNYSEYGWIDKAAHALLAGHEDVSEYNDLFWAKYHELDDKDGKPGEFNRSNLKPCEPGYEPRWVTDNAGYDKWGFVMYRTDYDEDDEAWAESVRHMNHTIRAHLELEAITEGYECDPDHVRDRAVLEIIEDETTLKDAPLDKVRALWRERVDAGLVESGMKMGGWRWGWFRLNLNRGRKAGDDTEGEDAPAKLNGLSLNLCLVYDWHTRVLMSFAHQGMPATGPRDPWEPFLVAVDGMWSAEEYQYLTSWAHEYAGTYGVALSLLFNDFHGKTFEREMERSAPAMLMGGPTVDGTAPILMRIFQALLTTTYPVARPGRYPFNDRIQELQFPFVREDSHWVLPAAQESSSTEEEAASTTFGDEWINATPKMWVRCEETDEDQEGCFQMGNFYVKEKKSTPRATGDAAAPEVSSDPEMTAVPLDSEQQVLQRTEGEPEVALGSEEQVQE